MAYFEKTNLANNEGSIVNPATEETATQNASLLQRILNMLLSPLGFDKSLQRYRQTAIIESGTVTTVAAVTALTNITGSIGTYQATQQVFGTNQMAWAMYVRNKIT
jgi:hypothetical protein